WAPKVAWNGSNWLVVFEGNAPNGTGYYESLLQAVRVSPAGQVLDAKPIPLYGLKPPGLAWAVASDGNNWVVVAQGTVTGTDIVAVRISPAGAVLDPPTRTVVDGTYYLRSNLKLAYAGGVFLLTYNGGNYETEGVRFDSNLNVLGPPQQIISRAADDLAGAGNQFYLVWQELVAQGWAVYGTRLNTSGQKLDGNGDNLSGNAYSDTFNDVGVTWDGVNWRATWLRNLTELRAVRVNTSGTVLDPGGVAISGPSAGPTAGNGSGGFQIVWSPYGNADQGVATAHVSSSNAAGPNRHIAIGAPRQVRPDIATSGNGYMVVYHSATASGQRVLAQPLDAAGNPTTAGPVELASGDLSSGPGYPAVAWNGSVYLAAWSSHSAGGVVAQRLDASGNKLDPAPFMVIPLAFGPPDIAAVGDTFLVVGRKCGYSCQFIDAFGARVNGTTGAVLDATPIPVAGSFIGRAPAVTALGGRWLVVYHRNWSHDNPTADTGAVFVNTDGTVTGVGNLYTFSTNGGNGVFRIGLAANSSVAMMVQSAEITSGVETDLFYRFIYPDGSVGPVVNLTPWWGNQYNPQVAWDGSHFVVVYEEQKNRFYDLDMLDWRSDIFSLRVAPDGTVVDPQGFVFSTSPVGETLPAVASPQNSVSLIAAALMRNEAPFANYRIGYGFFGSVSNRPPVAVAAAAPSGGDAPLAVNFSSAGSTDPDGIITAYLWDFGDGNTSTQPNLSRTYTAAGFYVVHLTVTDNAGAQTTQAILVQATAPNQPPVAVAQAVPSSGPPPLSVTFYADGSYDPDGSYLGMVWTFHDGSQYHGSPAYYTYTVPGTYQATLMVTDGRGATVTDTVTVTVGGATTPTPTSTRTPTPTPTPTRTPTPTPAPGGCTSNCLRSTNISLSSQARRYQVNVSGQVTVQSETGATVRSATVFVTWTKPDGSTVNQSATTNTQGRASFSTSGPPGLYTLRVTNITRSGWTFDPANSVLQASINATLAMLNALATNDRRVELRWDAVAGASSYRVVRQTNTPYFEPSAGTVIATLSNSGGPSYSYVDATVDLGQWHDSVYYIVQSFDAGAALLTESTYAGTSPYRLTPGG
ncbi:MAG: PKD domain-containing protein, partial [Caldilineales bacterium]|nr:PKD domain-containing protein [Caldilineales bacterium]